MGANECRTVIAAARAAAGLDEENLLRRLDQAQEAFRAAAQKQFGKGGEW